MSAFLCVSDIEPSVTMLIYMVVVWGWGGGGWIMNSLELMNLKKKTLFWAIPP